MLLLIIEAQLHYAAAFTDRSSSIFEQQQQRRCEKWVPAREGGSSASQSLLCQLQIAAAAFLWGTCNAITTFDESVNVLLMRLRFWGSP